MLPVLNGDADPRVNATMQLNSRERQRGLLRTSHWRIVPPRRDATGSGGVVVDEVLADSTAAAALAADVLGDVVTEHHPCPTRKHGGL